MKDYKREPNNKEMELKRKNEENIELLLAAAKAAPNADVKNRWKSLAQQGIVQPKQRSEAWFAARKGRLTGSRWSSFFFISDEAEFNLFHDRIFGHLNEDGVRVYAPGEVFDAASQKRMSYGVDFEDNAGGDFLYRFGNCEGLETPCLDVPGYPWLASSPDGVIKIYDASGNFERVAYEIKCPSPKLCKKTGKSKFKPCNTPIYYYIMQIHAEMAATGTKACIFTVWNCVNNKSWYVKFDQQFWDYIVKLAEGFRDKAFSFSEFLHIKSFITSYAKVICKQATALHPRGGFESKFLDKSFEF